LDSGNQWKLDISEQVANRSVETISFSVQQLIILVYILSSG